jgi:basic membrane protein A
MKRVLSVLLIASLVLPLVACGGPTPAPTKPKILLSMKGPGAGNPFWAQVEKGAKETATALNVDLTVLAPPAETDVATQISQIEDQITKKVQAIVVAPTDQAGLNPTFNKAKAAKIPVLFVDTNAPWPDKLTYIGTDNRNGGKLAGEFLCKTLGNKGKVALITGVLTQQTHIDRAGGGEDALKACGITIAAKQPANSLRDLGQTVMENILTANPDLKGVFATNDLMALGAMEAIKAAKKTGIVVVGFDANPDAATSILAGEMAASIAQSPYNMGKFGVENALKAIKGETIPKVIDTGTVVVDKSNAAQYGGKAPVAKKLIVRLVTDIGGIDDKSFNTTAYKGVQDAIAQLGIDGNYLQSKQQTDYEKNIQEFINGKADLIVTVGFLLGPATAKMALANPNTKFAIVDYTYPDCWPGAKVGTDCGSEKAVPNVQGLAFQTDQAAFLAGYLAAAMSKTKKVGTFGGLQLPTVTIFMKGFQAGVEYWNAQKKDSVKVLGWDTKADKGLFTGTFTEPDKGKTAAKSLIDEGADVILPVAGLTGNGAFTAAKDAKNVLAIGVDTDQCVSVPDACSVLITSVRKNMDVAVFDSIKSVQTGTFKGGTNYIGTLANNGVSLAPFHEFDSKISADLKKELDQVKADLISGKVKTGVAALQ